MEYLVSDIIRAAKVAIDENVSSEALTALGDIDTLTGRINDSLAEIALRVLRGEKSFRGLYATGGDVTQALCAKFGASGLDLRDEVLPLAAYGLFYGGEFNGLHVVTKGGSQGNSDAINLCVNYLKSKLFI